jgi:hypothetical protein
MSTVKSITNNNNLTMFRRITQLFGQSHSLSNDSEDFGQLNKIFVQINNVTNQQELITSNTFIGLVFTLYIGSGTEFTACDERKTKFHQVNSPTVEFNEKLEFDLDHLFAVRALHFRVDLIDLRKSKLLASGKTGEIKHLIRNVENYLTIELYDGDVPTEAVIELSIKVIGDLFTL